MIKNQLIDLQEHCFKLLDLLGQLHPEAFLKTIDWLDIAAGVESVKVTTAKHDDTVAYCGTAMAYEDKRSELLSNLATRLTIFNFVWGSFESVAKTLLGDKRSSIVDRAINFLKQNYISSPPIAGYKDALRDLAALIKDDSTYEVSSDAFKIKGPADLNGLGLHVVRKIRNDLAHGSANLPRPDDWGQGDTNSQSSERRHLKLIDTCTRLVLLTVQMLLLVHVREKKKPLSVLWMRKVIGSNLLSSRPCISFTFKPMTVRPMKWMAVNYLSLMRRSLFKTDLNRSW